MRKYVISDKDIENLTKEDLFLSESYGSYINRASKKVYERHDVGSVPVRLISDPFSDHVAYTNGECCVVNVSHELIEDDLEDAQFSVFGLTYHEIGHQLFTNFTSNRLWSSRLSQGHFMDAEPAWLTKDDKAARKDIRRVLKRGKKPLKNLLLTYMHHLDNIAEDGRIEVRLLSEGSTFPMFYFGLKHTRYEQMIRSRDFLKNSPGNSEIGRFLSLALYYCKWLAMPQEEDTLSYEMFLNAKDSFNKALVAKNGVTYHEALEAVIVKAWPVFCDTFQEKDDGQDDAGESDDNNQSSESSKGGKSSGSGSSVPNELTPEMIDTIEQIMRELSERDSAESPEMAGEDRPDCDEREGSGSGTGEEPDENRHDCDEREGTGSGTGGEPDENGDDEDDGESSSSSAENGSDSEESSEGSGKNLASMLEELKKQLESGNDEHEATGSDEEDTHTVIKIRIMEAAQEAKEEEEFRQITRNVAIITADACGDLPNGIRFEAVKAVKNPRHSCTEDYANAEKQGRQTAKRVKKFLPKDPDPVRIPRRYSGDKFETQSIFEPGFKHFSKLVREPEAPSLSVGILIDESGSMWSCERYYNASLAATCLASMCHDLKVPVTIYGHSENGAATQEIRVYADWAKNDKKDFERLQAIHVGGNNRDGAGLAAICKRMDVCPTDRKLLFVISDGQPNARNYGGNLAKRDIQDVVQTYTKKGFKIVAVAIGDDKPQIEEIYGKQRFMDCSDLSKLPETMSAMLRRIYR